MAPLIFVIGINLYVGAIYTHRLMAQCLSNSYPFEENLSRHLPIYRFVLMNPLQLRSILLFYGIALDPHGYPKRLEHGICSLRFNPWDQNVHGLRMNKGKVHCVEIASILGFVSQQWCFQSNHAVFQGLYIL